VPSNWIKCATGDNHTLIIPNNLSINPANLFDVGDIIGVFYKNGAAIASGGIVQYNRLNTAVAIQGDDASTSVKDGFSSNEAFILQRFSSKFGTIHDINGDYEPINGFSITAQGNYQNRGISKLKAINTGSTGCLPFDKGWNLISACSVTLTPHSTLSFFFFLSFTFLFFFLTFSFTFLFFFSFTFIFFFSYLFFLFFQLLLICFLQRE
jgi:hypothetical protein